ncbi:MAG TPA: energy transducer TonB [Flammeovirgaceae bacterium]|nr:energy transducer TonB [Flammeovirgaceae bacterium]
MEARKNPKYDLRQYQTLFFNIGLVLSLLMVIAAFEWRFYDKEDLMNMGPTNVEFVETMDVPLTEQPPPPPPKALKNVEIIAVEDVEDIEEDIDIDLDIDMTEDMAIEEVQPVEIEEPEEEETEEVFLIVEEPPAPVGGMEAFYNYVNENIQYPRQARTMRIEGRVFVQFVVDKDGSITNVEVLKGIGGGCDEEAVRVVKNAPKWNPGKQRGRPVRVKMVLPITFKLL